MGNCAACAAFRTAFYYHIDASLNTMTLFKRRRLLFWLVRAHLKRYGKTIFFSFLIGLIVFYIITANSGLLISKIVSHRKVTIGIVGAYTVDTLPNPIVNKISQGLTTVDTNGLPKPAIASSWMVKDSGRTYEFLLRHNAYFSDGQNVTSDNINYNFANVKVKRPDRYTIIFNLQDRYAPFLLTVATPIFKDNFVGVGSYKVADIHINGSFVESLTIKSIKNASDEITYLFYPTEIAVKTAFVLGEVTDIEDLHDIKFGKTNFSSFPNAKVSSNANYNELVTLFYNTRDQDLGDRRLRDALQYAIPDSFSIGKSNSTPYSPLLWIGTSETLGKVQDLQHAKLLITPVLSAAKNNSLSFTFKVLPEYESVARVIGKEWEKIGVKTKIEVVDSTPTNFQIFLGRFTEPKDPDQYSLWHSQQTNNITNYDNKRIDKLLEDGRTIVDMEQRKAIYQDFQKYLLDDPPASFLFFPYEYTVVRK